MRVKLQMSPTTVPIKKLPVTFSHFHSNFLTDLENVPSWFSWVEHLKVAYFPESSCIVIMGLPIIPLHYGRRHNICRTQCCRCLLCLTPLSPCLQLGGWAVSGQWNQTDFNSTLRILMKDYATFPFFSLQVGRDPEEITSGIPKKYIQASTRWDDCSPLEGLVSLTRDSSVSIDRSA